MNNKQATSYKVTVLAIRRHVKIENHQLGPDQAVYEFGALPVVEIDVRAGSNRVLPEYKISVSCDAFYTSGISTSSLASICTVHGQNIVIRLRPFVFCLAFACVVSMLSLIQAVSQPPVWNSWWVVRGGTILRWDQRNSLSFFEAGFIGMMAYKGGLSCQGLPPFNPSGLIVDATGVRSVAEKQDSNGFILGDTIYWQGSFRRNYQYRNQEMYPSSTSQIGLVPNPSNGSTLLFATPLNLTEPREYGGYQDYSLSKVDLIGRTVTLVDSAFSDLRAIDTAVELSTEMIGVTFMPMEKRVWFVFPFIERGSSGDASGSIVFYAYKYENDQLFPPVRSVVNGAIGIKGKLIFSVDGTRASIGNMVLDFNPTLGIFRSFRILMQPNICTNPAFSPTGRYVWVPGYRIDIQGDSESVMHQFDLTNGTDSISPIATISLKPAVWYNYSGYVPHALARDCKLYFSMNTQMFRVDHPDEVARQADTLLLQWLFDYEPNRPAGFGGMPDLVNRLSVPPDSTSCLWPRADYQSDTVCIGECLLIKDISYSNIDSWEWHFEGGTPAVYRGNRPPCITYSEEGEYLVRLIVRNTLGIDTIERTCFIYPQPVVSAGPDVTVCTGEKAVLTATGAVQYSWKPTNGLDSPNSAATVVTPIQENNIYIVTGIDENGCSSSDTVIVSQGTMQANASKDIAICRGGSTILQAGGGTQFRWWPTEGLSDTLSPVTVASPNSTTTYYVEVVSGVCMDTARVTVSVRDQPTVTAPSDTTICRGQEIHLKVSINYLDDVVVRWLNFKGDTISTRPDVDLFAIETATYTIIASNEYGCSDTDEVTITVLDIDGAEDIDTTICSGAKIILFGNTYSPDSDTVFDIIRTFGNCFDTAEVKINVDYTAIVVHDTSVCEGEYLELNAFTTDGIIQWFDMSGTVLHTGPTYGFDADESVTVVASIRSLSGCYASDTVSIVVIAKERLILSFGSATAYPGEIVSVPVFVEADNVKFPIQIEMPSLWPMAIPISVEGGQVINAGELREPIRILINAPGALSIYWQTYLASDNIGVVRFIPQDVPSCAEFNSIDGTLVINACGLEYRSIKTGQGLVMKVFDLNGIIIFESSASDIESFEDLRLMLPRGFYIIRLLNSDTFIDFKTFIP